MRRFALLLLFTIAVAGCRERRDEGYESFNGDTAANVTPELREFILVSQRSYYYSSLLKSLRRESDQPRDGRVLHSLAELQCPDRFHLLITGAAEYERYTIGTTMYERRGHGKWLLSTMKGPPVADLSRCTWAERQSRRRPPDEAEVEMMLHNYRGASVSKLGIETHHGIKCQMYVHRWDKGPDVKSCYAIEGPGYEIYSEGAGTTATFYDFNQPIEIKPPKT